MTVPHAHQQLAAFNAAYADPIDPSSQVDRMPGTPDAVCICRETDPSGAYIDECDWPFCPWKPEPQPKEDE